MNEHLINNLKHILKQFYADDGPERVGFVISENQLVEVENKAAEPTEGFIVSPRDIIKYTEEDSALATWHTHPDGSSNLSGEDYKTFKSWSKMYHFIIGKEGVRCFKFDEDKKAVMEC